MIFDALVKEGCLLSNLFQVFSTLKKSHNDTSVPQSHTYSYHGKWENGLDHGSNCILPINQIM